MLTRHLRPASSATVLLLLAMTTPLLAAGIYGGWEPNPNVPFDTDRPLAELTVAGTPSLLVAGEDPTTPFDAYVWSPAGITSLTVPPNVTVSFVEEVIGMQSAAGPRVYASGDFTVGGVGTRLIVWDGNTWDLPSGAVSGVVPRAMAVRATPTGPELWVGGDLMGFPGLAGARALARTDGSVWLAAGDVLGIVDQIVPAEAGLPNGDVVAIEGNITAVDTIVVNRLARFTGVWDDLDGGVAGSDLRLSWLAPAGQATQLWVTSFDAAGLRVDVHDGTGWIDRTPVFPVTVSSQTPPRRFLLLPTFFGEFAISDGYGAIAPSSGATLAYDLATGGWQVVPSNVRLAFVWEGTSGLYPNGTHFIGGFTGTVYSWEVGDQSFIRGDVDGSGTIAITDVIVLLAFLFPPLGAPSPVGCNEAMDLGDDGNVNIGDALFLLGYLFPQGAVPTIPPPFPNCDLDFDLDPLDCDVHAFCP